MVTQLSNTKKHKDELRKARRGSAPKQADVAAAGEKREKYDEQIILLQYRGEQETGGPE